MGGPHPKRNHMLGQNSVKLSLPNPKWTESVSQQAQMTLRSAAITNIGRVRKENEDRFLCSDELQLYGVADGIGGLPCGAEAATRTVATVVNSFKSTPPLQRKDCLVACTLAANREVLTMGRSLSPLYGVGTTLTFGCVIDDQLHLAHVGDSRCYLIRNAILTPLTMDHNVENESRVRRAQGKADIYVNDRNRGALTKCIGQIENPIPDVLSLPLMKDDRILFCTDGISRMIDEEELAAILSENKSLEDRAEHLIALANDRGGYDNSTAVLLQVE